MYKDFLSHLPAIALTVFFLAILLRLFNSIEPLFSNYKAGSIDVGIPPPETVLKHAVLGQTVEFLTIILPIVALSAIADLPLSEVGVVPVPGRLCRAIWNTVLVAVRVKGLHCRYTFFLDVIFSNALVIANKGANRSISAVCPPLLVFTFHGRGLPPWIKLTHFAGVDKCEEARNETEFHFRGLVRNVCKF